MKIVKRILTVLLALVAALILFLVVSIAIDSVIGRDRLDAVTNILIPGQNGEPDVRAYVAVPDSAGPFPVVIMIHEFYGLNESIVGKADALAQEGYLVVAPDTFRGSTTAWIPHAIYQVISTKPEQVNQDLDSVYSWIQSEPRAASDHVAIAGFCYGGRTSLLYSLHNHQLAATVIFYGSPETDPQVLKSLPGPVLGIFGGADMSIPVEDVKKFEGALNQAEIPNEITIYEGQPHAFVKDIEGIRAGGAQRQAWEEMLQFLEQNLKGGRASSGTKQLLSFHPAFVWRYYLMLVYEHAFGTASH